MTIIIKPTFNCNFRCLYCYLANDIKADDFMMDVEVAKSIVKQAIDYCCLNHRKKLTLIWHGGEPLLWGNDKFRHVFEYTAGLDAPLLVRHGIQTNLSLINDNYRELFKSYDVRVGFSIDGVRDINDNLRLDMNGDGTFDLLMPKMRLCRERGLNIGAIVVGSRLIKGRIAEIYEFLCMHRLNFKFNPLFLSGEATRADAISVTPIEYADMSNHLFDLWFFDRDNHLKESTFTDIVSTKKKSAGCMFSQNCQDDIVAISPRGDIFPCGRFCETDTRYSYGNINEESLAVILQRRKKSLIYRRSEFIKKSGCYECWYYDLCHGGCLHDGFLRSGDFKSKTFLCTAYKKIFRHIESRLQEAGMA